MRSFAFQRFWPNKTGATSIEYGLIAVAVSVALILALNGLRANYNADCSAVPARSVSTGEFDKMDLAREPGTGKQQNFEKASAGSLGR
ncbi:MULTISPECIES: Flp family type IVb pilin [Bradyrhizobium]|jgi:Flp pilus assembly pilin Flp|uniref:Flp pilus assembly pilin Flp n=1 Tax=Bradyrhizobium elkanii TaxID=29448 RepID=A0A4Q4K7X4_BRAEL|nr:Flp family type IVb pilin [Bradyrhizobium elkanii]MCS4007152.1 Flp pilus assembly pilin Flp [Bradyrhizobium elkanii USDA 61]NLS73235.1 Flp family type IVb pilin [Bradyrhizobium brasilense]QOZ15684.1 Flp family type IVb pilin [Bradyrhizobium sp. CCBAU 21365]UQD79766.1 Flp family type IVb pilin [Bradyrhizobium elkanii USDA 76]MBP1299621.1 Flp pilus assembly pilin Flp [Bradyrhizobium elkanii]